jgi:hypothetical protein
MKRIFTIFFSAALLFGSTPSASAAAFDDNTFEATAADIIVVRPVSFAATIIGSALFLVSLPVTAIAGNVQDTAEALVYTPGRHTFTRPVGELSTLGD